MHHSLSEISQLPSSFLSQHCEVVSLGLTKTGEKININICIQKLDSFFSPSLIHLSKKGRGVLKGNIIYREKILTATSALSSSINVSTTL